MCLYWCHSFSVLQSVKQRHGTAMKKNRLRSFSLSFVLFTHKSRRFPQSFFFFPFHLSFYFSIFSLLLPHQGKEKLRFAIWISNARWFKMRHKHKSRVYDFFCQQFVFFLIETNPWQVEEKRQQFILHTLYHFILSVKVKVKTECSLNLVLVLDNNITAVLLFVAAAAERVYGPWSPLRGKKTRLFWMKRKNLGAQPCKLICSCCMMGTQLASLTCAQQIIIAFFFSLQPANAWLMGLLG